MQGYTRAQVEALAVPVLETVTLHLDGQPFPVLWLDAEARPEVAQLPRTHHLNGPLSCTSQRVATSPLDAGAVCWLVVDVECPLVRFALSFPLATSFADLVDVATSGSLWLLCGDGPLWLVKAARRAEEVDVELLQPVLAGGLTLGLEDTGCLSLAAHLITWLHARQEREVR